MPPSAEAETVPTIFTRYLELGSIRALVADLKRFPPDLTRWDSQEVKDERVFVY
jgi:hypothetical protein